ncbi:hypothetical protein EB796_018181 [Bugula neritina]|uniref:Uncharacterized protein n=1 Tax=Bugula neritina TaxID=10212 RepID=A0A7J7JC80_BUGNE|nr:hypothetical protein EB796_018181 [Bugula neritina]
MFKSQQKIFGMSKILYPVMTSFLCLTTSLILLSTKFLNVTLADHEFLENIIPTWLYSDSNINTVIDKEIT